MPIIINNDAGIGVGTYCLPLELVAAFVNSINGMIHAGY